MYRDGQGWNAFPSVEQFPTMRSVVSSDPALFIRSWLQTLLDIPRSTLQLIPHAGLILGVLGVLLWCADLSAAKLIVAVALTGYSLLVALVWIEARFLIPLAPFVALCISRSIEAIPERAVFSLPRSRHVSRWSVPLQFPISVAILIEIVSASLGLPAWFRDDQADEYVKAAEWLKTIHAGPETTAMVAKPHIPFFSGTTCVRYREYDLQFMEPSELNEALARIRPDYFVYDERYASVEFPQFRNLLETGYQTENLRPVLTVDSPMRLVVFRYDAQPMRSR